MKSRLWLYLGILIVSGIVVFIYTDRTEPPNPEAAKNASVPPCKETFVFDNTSQVCRKENPLGHSKVPIFQFILWGVFVAATGAYLVESYRMHDSNKIQYFEDKYEKLPIPRSPDYYIQQKLFWTYRGYNAHLVATDDEVHVAKLDMVENIGGNFIIRGSRQQVTEKYLFEYIGYNSALLDRIIGHLKNPKIFVAMPITDFNKLRGFHTLKGGFSIGVDRFKDVLPFLLKRKRGIDKRYNQMSESNMKMLTFAKDTTQITANIGEGVRRTRGYKVIEPGSQPAQEREQGSEQQQREQM